MKTNTSTTGNFPIVQIEENLKVLLNRITTPRAELVEAQIKKLEDSTISKMETIQKNQSYKDSVCSILEHTYEITLKVGGCPSIGSGTVRLNPIFSSFTIGVHVYG